MLVRTIKVPGIERRVLIVVLYLFCTFAFGIDIALEISVGIREQRHLSYSETVHFAMELLAECALILATIMSFQSYQRLRDISKSEHDLGHAIRTGFDRILMDQFQAWNLTKSEREIAILAIRGLSIAEIAAHRNSKEGTVKSHLHHVYTKSSVSSRSDLLAKLMDELLYSHDLSIDPKENPIAGFPDEAKWNRIET